MKKILFIILSASFLFACSNDEQTIKNEETVAFNLKSQDLALYYDTMLNSQSYIDYINAFDKFYNKLNYTGDLSAISSPTKLLGWINGNISVTGFKNYAEAQSEFDNLVILGAVSYNDNTKFWNDLKGSSPGEFAGITYDPVIPQTPSQCEDGCTDNFNSCMKTATDQFSSLVLASFSEATQNEVIGQLICARIIFAINLSECDKTFIICLETCGN